MIRLKTIQKKTFYLLLTAAGIAGTSFTACAQEEPIDEKVVVLLRESTRFVGGLKDFSVDAQNSFEDILDSGHRVSFELAGSVTVSRPARLRTERLGNNLHQVFYYNGKTLVLHDVNAQFFAEEPAPGTIEDMFQLAYDSFGISTPISDLVHRDAFPLLMKGVTLAAYLGEENIRGVKCHHILLSRPDVDFQMWIASEGNPYPIKYVVTDTGTSELLSIATYLSNWKTELELDPSVFEFVPPEKAQIIPFLKDNEIN